MLLRSATRVHGVRCEREGSIRVVMSDRWRMSPGLRRTSAVVAIAALAIGGAKIASDHTMPGSGFSTVATVAADPTGGPTGGPGGPGGMNGSQFQPPGLPPQMPDYQGGINQPPLDQNSGISIYNTGSPGAQQVPGQQGGQQPQQAQQPAHGTQIPDYQTNPGYTQGPGKPNPDYQAPQQQAPQQGQQPQQQPQQQQPSQAPTQTQQPSQAPTQSQQPKQPQEKQDDDTQSMQQRQLRCNVAMSSLGAPQQAVSAVGGAGTRFRPARFEPGDGDCNGCDTSAIKSAPSEWTDYYVYQRADIRNMADMKSLLQAQMRMKNMDSVCAAVGDLAGKSKTPAGQVAKGTGALCSASVMGFDDPMIRNITDAINQGKCILIESYGGFKVNYLIKPCG